MATSFDYSAYVNRTAPVPVRRRDSLSAGSVVILWYLGFFYLLPILAIAFTGYQSAIYRDPPLSLAQWGYVMLLVAAVVAGSIIGSRRVHVPLGDIRKPPFRLQIAVIAVLIVFAILGTQEGLGGFRYSATGLSESLSFSTVIFVIAAPILEALLFMNVFYNSTDPVERHKERIIAAALCVGLYFTATGIGSAMMLCVAIGNLSFKGILLRYLFRDYAGKASLFQIFATFLTTMIVIAAIMPLILAALLLGQMLKAGETASSLSIIDTYADTSVSDFLYYAIGRASTAWVSLRVAVDNYSTAEWGPVIQNLTAPIGNFLFRIDTLLGGSFGLERPYEGSLSRLNYMQITLFPVSLREGTSPGMIGSFVMAFPLPFSIIAVFLYAMFLGRLFTALQSRMPGKLTGFGCLFLLYLTRPLFSSPVDFLLIIDTGAIYMFLYAFIAWGLRKA